MDLDDAIRSTEAGKRLSERQPLVDDVHDVLADMLLNHNVGPGERLNIDALSRSLGVSPTPIREEDFLTGLYSGLAAASVPSVGVEDSNAQPSAVPPFRAAGLATVDALDTTVGQVALVFLLEGARPGSYGLGQDAVDGVLPAAPLTAPGE